MPRKVAKAPERRPVDPVQQLYAHLDVAGPEGNVYLAWYGQLRAKGLDHIAAIDGTLEHFRIREERWYQLRLERGSEFMQLHQ